MKKLSQEGGFSLDAVREIMTEVKKGDLERVTFRNETLRKYFPKSYSTQQMQDTMAFTPECLSVCAVCQSSGGSGRPH